MKNRQRATTLVELLIASSIIAFITAAAAGLLLTTLHAARVGEERARSANEMLVISQRLTSSIRDCSALLMPNARVPKSTTLAFGRPANDDGDAYFGLSVFPRADEDPGSDLNNDNRPGVWGLDDDGDGAVDEGNPSDDDEDGFTDEDPLNGTDDDGDGRVDEDPGEDLSDDGAPGFVDMDDDGDGNVDEGPAPAASRKDDDEDGSANEDGLDVVVYILDAGAGTLSEHVGHAEAPATVVATGVTSFSVRFEPANSTHVDRVHLHLATEDGNGVETVTDEYVLPRNLSQRWGKKVR